MRKRNLFRPLLFGLLTAVICFCTSNVYASDKTEKKMDSSIGTGDLSKKNVKNWMNPYITIGDASITLSWGAKTRQSADVSLAILENVLIDLPKEAWPYGRIVRLSENGVSRGSQETKEFRSTSRMEIEKILKKLDVLVDFMPSS